MLTASEHVAQVAFNKNSTRDSHHDDVDDDEPQGKIGDDLVHLVDRGRSPKPMGD